MSSTALRFALVVPVKRLDVAKSRLDVGDDRLRRLLVEAFARDVLAAAGSTPAVSVLAVVSDDDLLGPGDADAQGSPVTVRLPDEGGGDLNRAISAAVARLADSQAHASYDAVAVLCADVPCVRPAGLAAALDAVAAAGRGFIADAQGTGTTLLGATLPLALDPHFGPGSAARHLASGAGDVTASVDPAVLATVRRDVDTAEDLAAAHDLGPGEHTTRVLAQASCPR